MKGTGRAMMVGVLLAAPSGCADDAVTERWVVTDSAGVTIVTSSLDGFPSTTPTELVLSLGSIDDGGPTDFFEISDLELVDSARLLVANGGTEEIRVFALDGTYLSSFGRAGRGPREFMGLSMVQELGDSVLTYDSGNDRISVRLFDGAFVRSYRLEWFGGAVFPVDLSAPGRTVAVTGRLMTDLEGTGVVVDTALVSLYDEKGNLIDSIARLPHNARFVQEIGQMRRTLPAPYTPVGSVVGWGDAFCYSFGTVAEVDCYDDDGALTATWRVTAPEEAVLPSHVAEYWASLAADSARGYSRLMEESRRLIPFPGAFPGISRMVNGDRDQVWAKRYRLPGRELEEWWVFEEGRLIERVSSPAGFELLEVEAGLLAGVWTDELGIEYVQVYRRAEILN